MKPARLGLWKFILGIGLVGLVPALAQAGPPERLPAMLEVAQATEAQAQFAWTYADGDREVMLEPGHKLPTGGTLFLRARAGKVPLTLLLFKSNKGVMERTAEPTVESLEAGSEKRLVVKPPKDPKSKAYLVFLIDGTPESNEVKELGRTWSKRSVTGASCADLAQMLYDKATLWTAENKGGANLAGDIQHEVGAVRGFTPRPAPTLPVGPPENWPEGARLLKWMPGQHPVVISRFVSKS